MTMRKRMGLLLIAFAACAGEPAFAQRVPDSVQKANMARYQSETDQIWSDWAKAIIAGAKPETPDAKARDNMKEAINKARDRLNGKFCPGKDLKSVPHTPAQAKALDTLDREKYMHYRYFDKTIELKCTDFKLQATAHPETILTIAANTCRRLLEQYGYSHDKDMVRDLRVNGCDLPKELQRIPPQ